MPCTAWTKIKAAFDQESDGNEFCHLLFKNDYWYPSLWVSRGTPNFPLLSSLFLYLCAVTHDWFLFPCRLPLMDIWRISLEFSAPYFLTKEGASNLMRFLLYLFSNFLFFSLVFLWSFENWVHCVDYWNDLESASPLTQIVKGHLFTWHIKPRMVNKKNLCFEWPSDCMCSQELNDLCLLCCCFPSILFHVVVKSPASQMVCSVFSFHRMITVYLSCPIDCYLWDPNFLLHEQLYMILICWLEITAIFSGDDGIH